MKEQLEMRLNELKNEFEAGQRMLVDLQSKQSSIRETVIRISGAIQVLEEVLAKEIRNSELAEAPITVQAESGK